MARRVPTWAKWLIGAAVAVLVLVTVGPFVYIHFIEGSPKPKLSLDSITTTTAVPAAATSAAANASGGATTASAGIDGTWHVADGSQAGYRVKEVLFGQSTTAVGRTSSVTGQATINGTQVTAADFSVDIVGSMLKSCDIPEIEDEDDPNVPYRIIGLICENDAMPALDSLAGRPHP